MGLHDIPREWLLGGLLVALVLLLGQAAWLALVRWTRRRRILGRVHRAGDAERRAAQVLRKRGYDVEGVQVGARYDVLIDGQPVRITLRADYIATRRGQRYVVEVKSGAVAPRIQTAATRRQLLEYQLAFEVHGLLLFDAETERLHTVEFPEPD